jgi:hypothetical protein
LSPSCFCFPLDEVYSASSVRAHKSLAWQEPRDRIAKVHLAPAQERLQQSQGEYTAEQLYLREDKADWRSFSSYTSPKLSIKHTQGQRMVQAALWHMPCGNVKICFCNLSNLTVCMQPATMASTKVASVSHVPKLLVSNWQHIGTWKPVNA